MPYGAADFKKTKLKYIVLKIAEPILKLFTILFKRQCNLFSMIALKPRMPNQLWPWLTLKEGKIVFNQQYAKEHFNVTSEKAD